jgi:(E)-4-hydroxy-3-methylbut-2-enyl-diphosphate synthase
MDASFYCVDPYSYKRLPTRKVQVGNVSIGGDAPFRLQSMTTTDTMDTAGTVDQSIRMIEAGSELVRITAPSKKDAENLSLIKEQLVEQGFSAPLVADIHFTPNAAEVAADYVEKVRVNPGNYADKKKFEDLDFSDESYASELERIREKFTPLVLKCKELGRAMRIGTNHGSLSDRIMSRYGDTPLGMVESAMEFIRICESHDYHELVISMKASNPKVMVQAYRLLVATMRQEKITYPLHLGVTEAGDGEDGRIKSAMGIGALLEDGIGDTIRVSLTEEPEAEIPVAEALARRYESRAGDPIEHVPFAIDPYEFNKRHAAKTLNFGGSNVPRVIIDVRQKDLRPADLESIGYSYSESLDKWSLTDHAADFIYVGRNEVGFDIPGTLGIIYDHVSWVDHAHAARSYPLIHAKDIVQDSQFSEKLNFIEASIHEIDDSLIGQLGKHKCVLLLTTANEHGLAEQRAAIFKLMHSNCEVPVVLSREYDGISDDDFILHSSTDIGGLLIDGLGDGVFLKASQVSPETINRTIFGILQAARVRISKTEYISCPSCGRTLFDLQETTAKIRSRTDHLKGVKIGIMGCIVNGPGEMADADYGYVGTGPGKITLYKEKEVVKRNVPEIDAVDELIELIKEHGDWVEKPELV